jgi:hypothetical protein
MNRNVVIQNNNSTQGGIGFAGLLTIVFIVLKLCGVIAWSWWWVWSPIWITFLVFIATLVIVFGLALIFSEGMNR